MLFCPLFYPYIWAVASVDRVKFDRIVISLVDYCRRSPTLADCGLRIADCGWRTARVGLPQIFSTAQESGGSVDAKSTRNSSQITKSSICPRKLLVAPSRSIF
jgi:hypothetical protein